MCLPGQRLSLLLQRDPLREQVTNSDMGPYPNLTHFLPSWGFGGWATQTAVVPRNILLLHHHLHKTPATPKKHLCLVRTRRSQCQNSLQMNPLAGLSFNQS